MKKLISTILSVSALVVTVTGNAFAQPLPPTVVPEPGTLALLGLGAAGLVVYKKFRK